MHISLDDDGPVIAAIRWVTHLVLGTVSGA